MKRGSTKRFVFTAIIVPVVILICANIRSLEDLQASVPVTSGLGVDVDFYTGPVPQSVWLNMKQSGIRYVIAQAWGGRSRNEYAVSQLTAARMIGGMKAAAYVLLNYDDKVCSTFARPVRNENGSCMGELIRQTQPGARWQVRQALAALGPELTHVAFVAIDIEWFTRNAISSNNPAESSRRRRIFDAIDEVRKAHKRPVIYTRNIDGHWTDITGCSSEEKDPECRRLFQTINDPRDPIALWDVEKGEPDLGNFEPYGAWSRRSGRQYQLDGNLFGLPASRTVDLNVFDSSLFSANAAFRP